MFSLAFPGIQVGMQGQNYFCEENWFGGGGGGGGEENLQVREQNVLMQRGVHLPFPLITSSVFSPLSMNAWNTVLSLILFSLFALIYTLNRVYCSVSPCNLRQSGSPALKCEGPITQLLQLYSCTG